MKTGIGGNLEWRPIVTNRSGFRVRSIRHDNCISRYAESVDTCPVSRKASTEHPDPVDPLSPLTPDTGRSYYLLAVSLRFALPSGSLSLPLPLSFALSNFPIMLPRHPSICIPLSARACTCANACREVSPISRRRTAARHQATPPAG